MKDFFSPFRFSMFSLLGSVLLIACNSSNDSKSIENTGVDSVKVEAADEVVELVETADESVKAESLVQNMDASKLNPSQLAVQKLLTSCVSGQYAEAAKVIMYRGGDQNRLGLDSFNYQNENEANTVKVTCEVITSWLGASQSYEFISFQEEETEFGTQNVVEIMFKKEKLGVERHFFYLMETPKGMMLVNMI